MYRAVARMLRGDVACLLAGAGVLAFVVSTNAEKLVHVSTPAGAPEALDAAAGVRTGLPTQSSRSRDPRLAIPRPRTSGDSNGGAASGGIAGGDPGTSQSSGFEVGEGFAVGPIGGQVGWTMFAASTVEAHVDSVNPGTGDQHLRVGHDPAAAANVNVGAFSPNMGTFENTSAVVSVNVYIDGLRDYEVVPQSATEGMVVTRVRFSRIANAIFVLDAAGVVNTGALWIPNLYVNLTIDLDVVTNTIEVSYNGVLIYTTAGGVFAATAVQEVVLLGTNGASDTGRADFDDFDVAGGPPPTGACCNFDGADGCAILTPEACGGIAFAFYFGDDTLCVDCPLVDPSCGPGAGDCLVAHAGPGCDDIQCCALVCEAIPTCCIAQFGWDQGCADAAIDTFCVPAPGCGVIGTGDCTVANGTPYCDDNCGAKGSCVGCCETVCAVDAYCCDTDWDTACGNEALQFCGCEPADIPANDDCLGAIEVFVGPAVPVQNFCGTSGLPDHANCNDGFVTGLGIDVWYFHLATFDGALNVTPTTDDDPLWNTQLAVYEGCDCEALLDPEPYVCAPINGVAVVPVTNGTCYLIRLGGTFDGPTGSGTLELSAVPDACLAAANDCLAPAGTAGCSDLSCCAVVCLSLPQCCDTAWDQDCADAAQISCAPLPCPALDTAGANVDEAETCGLDINGGCNSDPDPALFTEIVSGDVVHGTAWADGASRDTDWYRLTIDPAADVNLDGFVDVHYSTVSELPIVNFLILDLDPTCEPPGPGSNTDTSLGTTAYGQSCTCVNPGVGSVNIADVIYVFAGTGDSTGGSIFEGYPCTVAEGTVVGNNYLLSVDVTDNGDQSPQQCGVQVTPCPWDCQASPDGNVGINDFLALLGQWTTVDTCDFDGGGVGINDFLALLGAWGPCP